MRVWATGHGQTGLCKGPVRGSQADGRSPSRGLAGGGEAHMPATATAAGLFAGAMGWEPCRTEATLPATSGATSRLRVRNDYRQETWFTYKVHF